MALTPTLNQLGRRATDFLDEKLDPGEKSDAENVNYDVSESIVIIGFGQTGQVLANFFVNAIDLVGWPYIGFDLNPAVVKESRKLGFPTIGFDVRRCIIS